MQSSIIMMVMSAWTLVWTASTSCCGAAKGPLSAFLQVWPAFFYRWLQAILQKFDVFERFQLTPIKVGFKGNSLYFTVLYMLSASNCLSVTQRVGVAADD
jgi:hypothetical protein